LFGLEADGTTHKITNFFKGTLTDYKYEGEYAEVSKGWSNKIGTT
jgi:hypothetical protein